MRTVFLHGESDRFSATAAALSERFGDRAAEAPGLVPELLRDKYFQDGLLARWTEADVTRFLAEVVPRRLVLPRWSAAPAVLHEWFDFLAREDLLMVGSAPLPALHAAIVGATPAYLAAMAEPSEWGLDKFWQVTAREHGVDADDPASLGRFLAAVDEGEVELDDDVLRTIEEREDLPQTPAYWMPPVRVPEDATPDTAAAGTPMLERMHRLHDWVGPGRGLREGSPDHDELAAALGCDRFTAGVTLEWARRIHLVREIGDRLVRTEISGALLAEPGLLWTRLWQSFVLLEEVFSAEAGELDGLAGGADAFPELVLAMLVALYSDTGGDTGGDTDGVAGEDADWDTGGVPVEQAVSVVLNALADEGEATAASRTAVRRAVVRVLDQWEAMGVVQRRAIELPERLERIAELVPEGEPEPTVVELAPLGAWAARGSLRGFGFVTPTIEELVAHPAEVVVLGLQGTPADVAEEVVSGWIGRRGRAAASEELADLVRRVDDPELRLGALWLLEHTGSEGVSAVQGLQDDSVCGPAARMWLRERPDVEAEVALQHGDELAVSLDAMGVTAQDDTTAFLADFQARSTSNQLAMLDEMARTRHACADLVLGVLAEEHPDEQVSAAAHRCLTHRRANEPV